MQVSSIKSHYDTNKSPAFGLELKGDTRKFLFYLVGKGKISETNISELESKSFKQGCWATITRDYGKKLWHVSLENERIESPEDYKELSACYNFLRYSQMPDVSDIPDNLSQTGRKVVYKMGQFFDITV